MPIPATPLMRSLLLVCAISLTLAKSEARSASPSLFYTLLPLNISKNDCLTRAYRAVASEVTGAIIQRAEDVALVNNEYNLAVHCRRMADKKSFATIIVTHQTDFNNAKGLALNIQHRMEAGLFK